MVEAVVPCSQLLHIFAFLLKLGLQYFLLRLGRYLLLQRPLWQWRVKFLSRLGVTALDGLAKTKESDKVWVF